MKVRLKQSKLLLLAILIPFLLITALVFHYGVNTPVTDQYALIPLFQKIDHHSLTISDLWAQHNEHRIFFPTLYLLALGRMTNWNIWAELGSSLVLALITAYIISRLITTTITSKRLQLLIVAAVSWLFFSPVQWQNWIWGWQLEWYMCVCAALTALFCLTLSVAEKPLSQKFILALPAAIIASYSLASGLFVWLVGLVFLMLTRRNLKDIAVWTGTGILATLLYLHHYISPSRVSPLTAVHRQPGSFLQYFFSYMGRPLSDHHNWAFIAGIILLITFVLLIIIVWRSKAWQRHAIWISLGFYAILTGIATSSSRMDLGIINAMSSRYTAFSNLFLIAVIVMAAELIYRHVYRRYKSPEFHHDLAAAGIVVLAIMIVASYYNGMLGLRTYSATFHYIAICTKQLNPSYDCLYQAYFPSTTEALKMIHYLESKHYAGY